MALCNPIKRLVPFDHTRENVGILVLTHPNCKCMPTSPDTGEYTVRSSFFYNGTDYTIVKKKEGSMFGKRGIPEITCSATGARIDTMLRIASEYQVSCDHLEKEFHKLVRGQDLHPPTPKNSRPSSRRSAASIPVSRISRTSARHSTPPPQPSSKRTVVPPLFNDAIPTFESARSREQPVKSDAPTRSVQLKPVAADHRVSFSEDGNQLKERPVHGTLGEQVLVNELKTRLGSRVPKIIHDTTTDFYHFYYHLMRRFYGKVLPIIITSDELADMSFHDYISNEIGEHNPTAIVVMVDIESEDVYKYLCSADVDQRIKLVIHRQSIIRI